MLEFTLTKTHGRLLLTNAFYERARENDVEDDEHDHDENNDTTTT